MPIVPAKRRKCRYIFIFEKFSTLPHTHNRNRYANNIIYFTHTLPKINKDKGIAGTLHKKIIVLYIRKKNL